MSRGNLIACIALVLSLLGSVTAGSFFIGSMDDRISHNETWIAAHHDLVSDTHKVMAEDNERHEHKLENLKSEFALAKTQGAVTNEILSGLSEAVKEFSINTRTLTTVVVRLDERVKTLEKTQ